MITGWSGNLRGSVQGTLIAGPALHCCFVGPKRAPFRATGPAPFGNAVIESPVRAAPTIPSRYGTSLPIRSLVVADAEPQARDGDQVIRFDHGCAGAFGRLFSR